MSGPSLLIVACMVVRRWLGLERLWYLLQLFVYSEEYREFQDEKFYKGNSVTSKQKSIWVNGIVAETR